MPALNFSVFVDKVLSGEKRQTVRPIGKRKYVPGDRLYLYTEQRTRSCRKLGESICTEVIPIDIMFMKTGFMVLNYGDWGPLDVYDEVAPPCPIGVDELAMEDGFEDEESFTRFFVETHKLGWADVLDLQIIKWGRLL